MTIFKIGLTSTSDGSVKYTIVVDSEKQTVDCSCRGGRIHGRCKHIRFYKKLIKELLENES